MICELQVAVSVFATFHKLEAALEAARVPKSSTCGVIVDAAATSPLLKVSPDKQYV